MPTNNESAAVSSDPEERLHVLRQEHAGNSDDAAEQEQPADIDVHGDGRNLRPDDGENAEDHHDHALGQEQLPVKAHRVPNGSAACH